MTIPTNSAHYYERDPVYSTALGGPQFEVCIYSINDVAKLLVELLFNFRSTSMCNDNPSTLLTNEDNLCLCCGKMICLILFSDCIPLSVYHLHCWVCYFISFGHRTLQRHTTLLQRKFQSIIILFNRYTAARMQTSSHIAVQLHC